MDLVEQIELYLADRSGEVGISEIARDLGTQEGKVLKSLVGLQSRWQEPSQTRMLKINKYFCCPNDHLVPEGELIRDPFFCESCNRFYDKECINLKVTVTIFENRYTAETLLRKIQEGYQGAR